MTKLNITMSSKIFLFILLCLCTNTNAQSGSYQIQVGTQFLWDKNVGMYDFPSGDFTIYKVYNEAIGNSVNYDISFTKVLNKIHGLQIGFGRFSFNSRLDFVIQSDIGSLDTLKIGVANRNYSIYLGYRFSKNIASKWKCHLYAGPIYAYNGKSDFYFKDHHFSAVCKPGVQYVSKYGLIVECNGVLMRSLENISMFESGSFIPFQWGLDLRVGKEF